MVSLNSPRYKCRVRSCLYADEIWQWLLAIAVKSFLVETRSPFTDWWRRFQEFLSFSKRENISSSIYETCLHILKSSKSAESSLLAHHQDRHCSREKRQIWVKSNTTISFAIYGTTGGLYALFLKVLKEIQDVLDIAFSCLFRFGQRESYAHIVAVLVCSMLWLKSSIIIAFYNSLCPHGKYLVQLPLFTKIPTFQVSSCTTPQKRRWVDILFFATLYSNDNNFVMPN